MKKCVFWLIPLLISAIIVSGSGWNRSILGVHLSILDVDSLNADEITIDGEVFMLVSSGNRIVCQYDTFFVYIGEQADLANSAIACSSGYLNVPGTIVVDTLDATALVTGDLKIIGDNSGGYSNIDGLLIDGGRSRIESTEPWIKWEVGESSSLNIRMLWDRTGNVGTLDAQGGSSPMNINSSLLSLNVGSGGDIIMGGSVEQLIDTVASATNILFGAGNIIQITGTTQIDSISVSSPQASGSIIYLHFAEIPQVTDGKNLKLAANFTASADDILTLVRIGDVFYEVSRSAN